MTAASPDKSALTQLVRGDKGTEIRDDGMVITSSAPFNAPETWAAGQTLSRLFPLRFGPAAGHRSLKRLLYIKNETVVDELVVGVEPGNRTDVVN